MTAYTESDWSWDDHDVALGLTPLPYCVCSHTAATHGTDRRGRAMCFSVACGCAGYQTNRRAA